MIINLLKKSGIIISIALGFILTAAAICLVISMIWPESDIKIISLISNNWLLTIFKIHSNIISDLTDPLTGINLFDIGILVLFLSVCLSLFAINNFKNKIWFIGAISLLLLGISLFLITRLAGRSAFMASGLIISSIMFMKPLQNKIVGTIGIIANTLLLVGDFTVDANLKVIPVLFGLGYILLIIWFFIIANTLLRTKI